jgi:YVTN family beta-propeller protein
MALYDLLSTITVGTTPTQIVVNPAGTRAYVGNNGSLNISVINLTDNSASLATGTAFGQGGQTEFSLAINPAGTFVYATTSFNWIVLNTSTNAYTTPFNFSSFQKGGLAVNAAGTHAYSCGGFNTMTRILLSNNSQSTSTGVGNMGGADVVAAPSGTRLWVSNTGSVRVSDPYPTYNTDIVVGSGNYGMAVNPAVTRLYVCNKTDGTVSVCDATSLTTTAALATVTVGAGPTRCAVSPDGTRVYVANTTGNTVSVINTATNAVIQTITGFTAPWGVAVNPAGTRLYVTNSGTNTVSVIDLSAPSSGFFSMF